MSGPMDRRAAVPAPAVGPAEHERARDLAAARLDWPLEPAETAFLDAHLAACDACAAVAAEYAAQDDLFAALRAEPALEAPRDLWARTSAKLETQGAGTRSALGHRVRRLQPAGIAGASRDTRRASGLLDLLRAPWSPVAMLAVIAIVVSAGFLNGTVPAPSAAPGTADVAAVATPIALAAGQVRVVGRTDSGGLQIQTGTVNAVCPVEQPGCDVAPSFQAEVVDGVGGGAPADAILSPSQDRIVLVGRDPAAKGVYVVTVTPAGPVPTAHPSSGPTTAPASPDGSPATTPDPSADPATATPATSPTTTPDPSASGAPEPSPSVAVTPAPGGVIQIAADVIVVGSVAEYDATGGFFAFTARPADGSAGPDAYLWNTATTTAAPITTDHASVFAGWDHGLLLVSRVTDGAPVTQRLDPATGQPVGDRIPGVWRPTIAPDGRTATWWEGTVVLAADGITWVPGTGRLVLGAWTDAGPVAASPSSDPSVDPSASTSVPTTGPASTAAASSATESAAATAPAAEAQVLIDAGLVDWETHWDTSGTVLGVWISDGSAADGSGTLSLFRIDPAAGAAVLDQPLLDDAPAFAGFSLQDGRAAWVEPAGDGNGTVQVIAWSGDTVGRLALPDAQGAVVR